VSRDEQQVSSRFMNLSPCKIFNIGNREAANIGVIPAAKTEHIIPITAQFTEIVS
jgi:hypothetical protein